MGKELILVILAAGMGSRFGGLKQIEPVGPNNEFIIDYSIYDAKKAGFNKIVFLIKRENYDVFKETIGKRVEGKIDVSYAFQDILDLPKNMEFEEREKPLGTAHAIWCCRNLIKGNFAIINADDFYGYDSFKVLVDYLKNNDNFDEFCMVGYKISNTLTENGVVKRGVCQEKNGYLSSLIESKVSDESGIINCIPLNGSSSFIVEKDQLVSMNMFGFTTKIFNFIENDFEKFYQNNKESLKDCEYLIPDVVFDNIKQNNCKVKVLKTDAKWFGVTYKEDKEKVVEALKEMTDDNIYPSPLWK
ncbi:MAG: sugar phosphate nucleotidyltransferase [bacterium]|nr:sugar phosphate nucleotidyltransferase [bacterium]